MDELEQDPFAGFEPFDPGADAPVPKDIFAEFEPFDQPLSPSAAIGAVASRGTGAFAQTAPVIPGAIMGARIGALSPFPQFTIPLGAVVGGTAGFMFGDTIADMLERWGLATSSIDDLPRELRPFGAAGEVIGGSVPFMAAPLYAARIGYRFPSSFAGNFLNKVIEGAGKSPRFFAALESQGVTGAAIAAGAAEHFAPGRPLIRAGAEIAGGFFPPGAIITTTIRHTVPTIINTARKLTPAGRQTAAGRFLTDAIDAAGEDPDALVQLLAQPDVPGVGGPPRTVAQKTGSRAIAEFEADLRTINQKFSADIARQTDDALRATKNAIQLLEGTGDPGALRAAAELRSSQFRLMLQSRVDAATREAVEKASAITADTPSVRAVLSRDVEQILDDVLKRARKVESDLWADIPGNTPVGPAGYNRTLAGYTSARSMVLKREPIDPVITQTIKDIQDAKNTLQKAARGKDIAPKELAAAQAQFTVEEMLKVRRRTLALARQAMQNDRHLDAELYGRIAEGILDDLDQVIGGPGSALDRARAFSRELNDVFIRSFVGKIEEVGRRGAETTPPEVLLKLAFASGEELGALQMRQIEKATRFLIDRRFGTPIDTQSWRTVLDAQERILRLAAAQSVERNAKTGTVTGVNMEKLRTFLTKNEEILQRFPDVEDALKSAIKSEAGRETIMSQVRRADTFLEKKAIISRILEIENAADAVRGALKSKQPIAQLTAMVRLAQRSGPDAVQGLRAAMIEDAFRSASLPGGNTSIPDLLSALSDPIRPGAPSLVDILTQNQLISPTESTLFRQLIERTQQILAAQGARAAGQPPLEQIDTMLDTAMRVIGSRAGSMAAGGRTGPQLIAASRGSQAVRSLLAKVPALKVQQLLVNALRGDPVTPGGEPYGLFKLLLERAGTPQQEEALVRRIHAYGVQAGIFAGSYHIEGEEP